MVKSNLMVNRAGERQCNSKAKSTGERCERSAMVGSTACWVHGGNTPKGIASPHYKNGQHQRYQNAIMPAGWKERLGELLDDPEYLSLRPNIAMHDTAIMQLLEGMERGEAGKLWELLKKRKDDMLTARAQGGEDGARKQAEALNSILSLIDRGYKDYMGRRELMEHHKARAALVETEMKRVTQGQQTLTTMQALTFASALKEAVRINVSDPTILDAIERDFGRLVRADNPRGTEAVNNSAGSHL